MPTCTCSHIVVNRSLNGRFRQDPSRTGGIQKRFITEFERRFKKLKREIIAAIIVQDVFGLSEKSHTLRFLSNLEPRQFEFARSDEKVRLFMRWLSEQEDLYLKTKGGLGLQVVRSVGDLRQGEQPWINLYIQTAYQQGIEQAGKELRKMGYPVPQGTGGLFMAAFNQPFHADRLALIYTRVYNELNGITNAMDQQISRVLAEGIANGLSPYTIARNITDRVDKIGLTRARMLARTEIVSAHHQATINEYEQWGIQGVKVVAEWLTAGFGVCPKCASLDGKVFSLEEIRGMIPVHPNCRCVAIPVIEEKKP